MSYGSPSDRRKRAETRRWAVGFVLFFGFPIYIAGYLFLTLQTAFWTHLGLIGLYLTLLLFFGGGSVVEMGVVVSIFSIVASLLFPVFKRAEANKIRRQLKIQRNANHR